MQSVIGINELKRFDSWNLPRRQKNGSILIEELKDFPLVLQLPVHNEDEKTNGFFVAPIVVDIDKLNCDIEQFRSALEAEKVPVYRSFWPQSYKERAYREHKGFGRVNFPFESTEYTNPDSVKYADEFCPNAAYLEERTFITMVHPTLEEEHMRLTAKAIKKVAEAYAK
jgi:dTDP-4-amino-4,6-dideoxygalactose transaminase